MNSLRIQAIIRHIAERTDSRRVALIATNPLGICLGALMWPPPKSSQGLFGSRDGAHHVLGCCDEVWESVCTEKIGTAFRIAPDVWQKSPAYRLIYRLCRFDYAMAYCLPDLPNGDRRFVVALRAKKAVKNRVNPAFRRFVTFPIASTDNDYTDAELAMFRKICEESADELSTTNPTGHNAPTLPDGHEPLILDSALTGTHLSPYLRALVTRFYGPLPPRKSGRWQLPTELQGEIRKRLGTPPSAQKVQSLGTPLRPIHKNRNGRVLIGRAMCLPTGTVTIDLFEDTSCHSELERYIRECRKLPRSLGRPTLKACLCIADGLWVKEIIAARLGLRVTDETFIRAYREALRIVTRRFGDMAA